MNCRMFRAIHAVKKIEKKNWKIWKKMKNHCTEFRKRPSSTPQFLTCAEWIPPYAIFTVSGSHSEYQWPHSGPQMMYFFTLLKKLNFIEIARCLWDSSLTSLHSECDRKRATSKCSWRTPSLSGDGFWDTCICGMWGPRTCFRGAGRSSWMRY